MRMVEIHFLNTPPVAYRYLDDAAALQSAQALRDAKKHKTSVTVEFPGGIADLDGHYISAVIVHDTTANIPDLIEYGARARFNEALSEEALTHRVRGLNDAYWAKRNEGQSGA